MRHQSAGLGALVGLRADFLIEFVDVRCQMLVQGLQV
jgi:hypothetical protein